MMKIESGLTGWGITESAQTNFILGMPYAHDVCEQVKNFCNINFSSSEQHVDARDSRIKWDNEDIIQIVDYFNSHDPFPSEKEIISIATGIIGNKEINFHDAFNVGKVSPEKMYGLQFNEISFKRKERVLTLSIINSSIKIHDKLVPVDIHLLFQRICVAKKTNDELKEYLTNELAPYP